MVKIVLAAWLVICTALTTTACSKAPFLYTNNKVAAMHKSNPTSDYQHTAFLQGHPTTIWYKLQQTSSSRLREMLTTKDDPIERGWIELTLINKRYNNSTSLHQFPHELLAWQQDFPSHPGNQLLPSMDTLIQLTHITPPKHLAVLLPQSGRYAASARRIREGLLNAYYGQGSKGLIKFYDTAHAPHLSAVYEKAIKDGANFIIGPLTKNEVSHLRDETTFKVPTIALNYSDNGTSPANFYEFGLSPEDEINMGAERAYQQGLSQAIIIAPNNAWGTRITQSFIKKWQHLGGNIRDTWQYQSQDNFPLLSLHCLELYSPHSHLLSLLLVSHFYLHLYFVVPRLLYSLHSLQHS